MRLGLSGLAAVLGLVVGAGFMSVSPAFADLIVCNRTDAKVGVAIGYKNQDAQKADGWVTEGWWNLGANSCKPLIKGELNARFYYVYGFNYLSGAEWTDVFDMCTKTESFLIEGRENCAARGLETKGFMEIDTLTETRWVVELNLPE